MPARDTDAVESHGGTAFDPVLWLHLAATPVLVLMALLTGLIEYPAPGDVYCGRGQGVFSLAGMAPMYALMSVFHAGPWIRLILRR